MSAIFRKFDRQSVCATCLSQDRKLFSVIDVGACAKIFCELFLKKTDRVCWECRHTLRKIIAFKKKAWKAQAWLNAAGKGQHSDIICLSSLDISMGIFLNVTDPGLTTRSDCSPEPVFVSVKQEVNEDEICSDERVGSGETSVERDRMKVKEEELDVLVFKIPKPTKRKAPASTDILTEMPAPRSEHSAPVAASATPPSASTRHRIVNPSKRKAPPPIEAPIVDPLNLYTEESLSEDGLLEWWQKKKKMKYYTQSIPLERCVKCVQPFDGQPILKAHANKHTEIYGDFECDICTLRLIDERELEFHKKLHYRILKCRYCDFTWDDVNSIRQHCSDLHGVKQTVWDCEQCQKQFGSAKKFNSHLRNHRREQCPQCGKSVTACNLQRHIMIQHRGGKPWHACGECGGRFRGEDGLKLHMRTHGTEVDPAAFCAECQIQFRDKCRLLVHMRSNKHSDASDYRFECEECGRKFVKRARLREHEGTHAGVAYPCDQCDKSFNSRRSRTTHVKNKHEGRAAPRDKLCDYCGRGFARKAQLSSHINSHTGARPFVCTLCGADFGHKSALYLHGRYKHKIQKIKKPETVTKNNSVTDSGNNSEQDGSGKNSVET